MLTLFPYVGIVLFTLYIRVGCTYRVSFLGLAHFICLLVTKGTLEEKIYQRQISKYGLSTILNEPMTNSGDSVQFSPEELKDLFSLPSGTSCQTHDLLDCNCQNNNSMFDEQCATKHQSLPIRKTLDMARMDGLRNWNHLSPPINEAACHDQLLVDASDSITFVFQNRV